MHPLRKLLLRITSELVWRVPGWPRRLLLSFSQAERGSYYDVLSACELTERRELRRRYLEHALDEGRHAGIFMDMVKQLGGDDRVQAVMADSAYLAAHGVVGQQTLFERKGELGFLAFVTIAEADAEEQFQLYLDRDLPDKHIQDTLRGILRDEVFHKTYSRAALDAYDAGEVKKAMRAVRWNRLKEGWLNTSRHIGSVVASVWLGLVYLVAVGPFRVFGRLERGGWQAPRPDARPLSVRARSQG